MPAKPRPATSLLEWVTGAIGLAVALALLGILVGQAASGSADALPDLTVEAGRLQPAASGHALAIEVRNSSRRTASAVQVEGVLKRGGQDIETSTATIDYVPGRSRAAGGMHFAEDPRTGQLELRVTGFQLP